MLIKKALQELNKLDEVPTNKHSIFWSSIANDLLQMDNKQAFIAKKLINDIVTMGSLNMLNENMLKENPIFK